MWREQLAGDEPAEVRIPRALDAWARYVEGNPYAARMFFQETTGDPEARAIHERGAGPGARGAGGDPRRRAGRREHRRRRRAGAGDGGRGDARGPHRARDLVDRPPRGAARADRRDRGQRDLDRLRAGATRASAGRPRAHRRACRCRSCGVSVRLVSPLQRSSATARSWYWLPGGTVMLKVQPAWLQVYSAEPAGCQGEVAAPLSGTQPSGTATGR